MDARRQFAPSKSKVLCAMLASATVAVAVVTIFALMLWPSTDSRAAVLVHFVVFGSMVVFPLAFAIGLPSYYLFRWMGWVTRPAAVVVGTALALLYPLFIAAMNAPGTVSWGEYLICAIAGALAAWVFCRIVGIGHASD